LRRRLWQLASGNFVPSSPKIGRSFNIKDKTFPACLEAIRTSQHKLICVNDTIYTSDFEKQKVQVQEAFKEILPEKSSFEK
jgi:Stealth protein CR4, conserved region 4